MKRELALHGVLYSTVILMVSLTFTVIGRM
jgi:hypothetical protein